MDSYPTTGIINSFLISNYISVIIFAETRRRWPTHVGEPSASMGPSFTQRMQAVTLSSVMGEEHRWVHIMSMVHSL